jgi:hypothetical protein
MGTGTSKGSFNVVSSHPRRKEKGKLINSGTESLNDALNKTKKKHSTLSSRYRISFVEPFVEESLCIVSLK